ncbi:MAG: VWA domain-containing protein, partial [Planctomycetota bacterium]
NRKAATGIEFDDLDVSVNRGDETVTVTAASVVPAYFAGLAGHDTFTVREATSVSYNTRVVELSLMLDVTGSMGGTKIDALRAAARDLVEEMIPENPRKKSNRVALAPYSAAVNVAGLAEDLLPSGTESVDGCVLSRAGAYEATADRPSSGRYMVAYDPANPLVDLDPTSGESNYRCPDATILPLSNDRDDLFDAIDALSAGGYTAGHLGAAWAWYLIAPEWRSMFPSSSKPARANDADTIKSVLLMTDGEFNTLFNGTTGDTSDMRTRDICDAMKADGVNVYAVAFEAPFAAEQTLRYCASSPTHYYNADNAAELRSSFVEIAKALTSLRLTD